MALGTFLSTVLPIAGSVLGKVIGGKKASAAAGQASQVPMNMYNDTKSALAPYMSTGTDALSKLASLWGLGGANGGMPNGAAMTSALEGLPGYQFGFDQSQKALDHSAAARGGLLSGNQLEATAKFGHDYGIQQGWQPYMAMLSALASQGQQGALALGGIGQNAAQSSIAPLQNQGTAQANMWGGLGNELGGLGRLFGGGGGGSGVGVTPSDMMNVGDMANFAGLF